MAGLFDDLIPAETPQAKPAGAFDDLVPQYRGTVLPFSKGADGKVRFDSNAGLFGLAKGAYNSAVGAVSLPGDVYAGRVDPKSDEAIGRATELGMWATPVNPAVRIGDRAIPGIAKDMRRRIPTTDELYAASESGYGRARDIAVDYRPDAFAKMVQETRAELEKGGFRDITSPDTFKIIDQLSNPPRGALLSTGDIESARSTLSKLSVDTTAKPADREAARSLLGRLEGFVQNADPATLVDRTPAGQGAAQEAATAYKDARGNFAAAKRSDKLEGIDELTDLRAAAANSGLNKDNTTRQRVVSELLGRRGGTAGFSPEEVNALEGVVKGDAVRNTLRHVGNLFGGGGGLGQIATSAVGALAGAGAGGMGSAIGAVGLPAIGYTAKQVANALAGRSLDKVGELVRTRSPLYQSMPLSEPTNNPALNMALIRALMGQAADEQR